MTRKRSLLIFCQAPADIQYTLELYKRYNGKREMLIYVVHVRGIYNFLLSLNLNHCNLYYIEKGPPNFSRKVYAYFSERSRLAGVFRKQFRDQKNNIVIFFSHFHDSVTSYFVKNLSRDNSVLFIDHYDTVASKTFFSKKPTSKSVYYTVNLWISTGIIFKIKHYSGGRAIEFDYSRYGIRRIHPPVISYESLKDFSYTPDVKQPAVLFLETRPRKEIVDYESYREIVTKVFTFLKDKNINIYLKGHPRAGASDFIDSHIDGEITAIIPAELINLEPFLMVLGITSSGMVFPALNSSVPVVSFIRLIPFSKEYIDRVQSRLCEASENRIKFINHESEMLQYTKSTQSG